MDFVVDSLRVIHARLHLDSIFHSRRGRGGGGYLCKAKCSDNSIVDADFCCLNSV